MDADAYIKMHDVEQSHWWFVGRRRIVDILLSVFIPTKVSRVLDIGCGTGNNFPLLLKYGNDVDGLEQSSLVLSYARQHLPGHCRVLQGDFLMQTNFGTTYDLITLFDVLEHIEDDTAAVQKIEALLVDGGTAVFTVPAFQFLWTEFDHAMHHYRRYTKKSLMTLLKKHTRLTVQKISYMNFFLFVPIVAIRWVKRLLGFHERSEELALPASWLNDICTRIFSFEGQWLKKQSFPFGVSLVCIVRKS